MVTVSAGAIEQRYREGVALRMRGDIAAAETVFREVLQHRPAHRDAAWALAFMLREQGRIEASADAVLAFWRHDSSDAGAALAAIGFLKECGAYLQAQAIVQDAQTHWPADVRIGAVAGEVALALGQFDVAAAALRDTLDRDPHQSAAWLRLAYCRRFEQSDDADVARFARGWRDATLDSPTRICAGFAFGKALDDLGDFAKAAEVLLDANAGARRITPWSNPAWPDVVAAQRQATPAPGVLPDDRFIPVFIVGLPRTGTTMVATALHRFAGVRDRGELNWIPAFYDHLHDQRQWQNPAALQAIASMIRAQMQRDDAPARFYIDKNPLNFRYLGLIAALFPHAKIIHCRRGMRDTALSIWMQHFAHPDLGFAYDFGAIAAFHSGYRSVMTQWRDTLALPVLEVDYEQFVQAPQAQSKRLGAFLEPGASAADDLVVDRQQPRDEIVTTASVWQVRQPVYTRSVGRWQHYAAYLPELVSLFGDDSA